MMMHLKISTLMKSRRMVGSGGWGGRHWEMLWRNGLRRWKTTTTTTLRRPMTTAAAAASAGTSSATRANGRMMPWLVEFYGVDRVDEDYSMLMMDGLDLSIISKLRVSLN